MPFLRNCPVTSQLLPKSAINRLQRWILTLMNYFLTVRAVNALTCWTVVSLLIKMYFKTTFYIIRQQRRKSNCGSC